MTSARQNFSVEAENGINQQIQTELIASYAYMSMASWLSRDDIALHGLAKYYREQSNEVPLVCLANLDHFIGT